MWAELAAIYAEGGSPTAAAVAWVHAIWESPIDACPPDWLDNWVRAEVRAGGISLDKPTADTVLARAPSPATARVAAALAVRSAFHPQRAGSPDPHFAILVERANEFVADLPVRLAWLLHLASAQRSGGDALGLARGRDRLFERLAISGLALDLDAPAFLRFEGGVGGDRFQAARDWLNRTREAIHKWLAKLATNGRMQWAGLDPDIPATAAYADLMLAWGASKLGDRTRAAELANQAEKALRKAIGPGVDPAVHRSLVARFRDRIRAVGEGRAADGTIVNAITSIAMPPEELSRYAIDKLTAVSRILDATGGIADPYHARDIAWFLGNDNLGIRLNTWATMNGQDIGTPQARSFLDELANDPTATLLPRVVLALAARPAILDADSAAVLVALLPSAFELLPEALRQACPADADIGQPLARLSTRLVRGITHLALRFDLGAPFAEAVESLAHSEASSANLVSVAPLIFRTLRKLGLPNAAQGLLKLTGTSNAADEQTLAFAAGWFVIGDLDRANRLLDEARDRLFVRGITNERKRTAIAQAYATALAYAPPRLALGRLEELFQRLDRITTTGATARYFALKPLELIDTAITAVVSEEFNLGPAVRGWLDDDEFRVRKRITRDLATALQ